MNCNLVVENNKSQLSFKNLQKYKNYRGYLTFNDLREDGKKYNFFEEELYLSCLQESIKKVIKDCKHLIDTYNLTGKNKTDFENELKKRDLGVDNYQENKIKLIKLGKIHQTLLKQSREKPLKTQSLPLTKVKTLVTNPDRKSKSLPVRPSGGGRINKRTRKFKKLPRVNSPKKINRNTNLNYTL